MGGKVKVKTSTPDVMFSKLKKKQCCVKLSSFPLSYCLLTRLVIKLYRFLLVK